MTSKEAATPDEWTTAEIDERQMRLAELAVKVWPLSGDLRRRRVVAKRVAQRRSQKKR